MNREYHRWHSPALNRDMELLLFGHSGLPVIVFPTSQGRFYDWEDRGGVGFMADVIERGIIRLVCVDSVDAESWYNYGASPERRVQRHLQYERYIMEEVIPFVHSAGQHEDGRVGLTGASFGAFHCALFAFRRPEAFSKMVAMSGKYDNSSYIHGYSGQDAYLTNPLSFLPNLTDRQLPASDGPRQLDAMRRMQIVIITGRDDPNAGEAVRLSEELNGISVPNTLDLWDGWAHDWPYWDQMLRKYFW